MSWIREADQEPIPGYRLIRPLGSGGFGEVWLCEAPGKILKAIKFVFGNLDASASGDGRARQEFHALQQVKEVRHPFVLSVERFDVADGRLVIVMELADRNLYDRFAECQSRGQAGIPRDELDGLRDPTGSHGLPDFAAPAPSETGNEAVARQRLCILLNGLHATTARRMGYRGRP